MNIASGPFYESGTFWAGAGTVVGVVSIAAVVWVTLRAANPKRRLWYSMPTVTSLVRRRKGLTRELKVTYGDEQLEFPFTVNIRLVSRGRLDIPRSAFDGDQPLQLDVGAAIVEVLNVTTSPNRPIPPVKIDSSKLFIGPSLIGRREEIVIALLVDGNPQLSPLPQALENVDIRQGDPAGNWPQLMRHPDFRLAVLVAVALIISVVALTVSVIVNVH